MTGFLIVPDADVTAGKPTTLANALYRDTATLSSLTNDTGYRAFSLSSVSDLFTPEAVASSSAQGAFMNDNRVFLSNSLSYQGSNRGMVSAWMRSDTSWGDSQRLTQMRVGSTIVFNIRKAAPNRMHFTLNNTVNYTSPEIFTADRWHHLLWSWDADAGRYQIWVNNTEVLGTYDIAAPLGLNDTITRASVGSETSGGNKWIGSIAEVWISTTQSLDISDADNRAKFISAGAPVDLGATGQLPTGTQPEHYLKGEGEAMSDLGSQPLPIAGSGLLTAAPTPIALPA